VASISIYAGARAPETLVVRVRRKAGSTFDATTGTSCHFIVRAENGDEVTWSGTIVASAPDVVTMSHVFDSLGEEAAQSGRYRLYPHLFLPGGGVARGVPLNLFILE
jgi:hypothetical protein